MSSGFPNPQLISDAHSLNIFAQALSQSAAQLANAPDREKESPENAKLKVYFHENLPKLKSIIANLETGLA